MKGALTSMAMGWFLIVGNNDAGMPIIVDKYPTREACHEAGYQSIAHFKYACVPAADEFEKGAK